MSETKTNQKNFIGYEYKEIVAESDMVSLFLDGYENFGWEVDEHMSDQQAMPHTPANHKVTIHLKRNRKIINKVELTRLQRNFEACVWEIQELEKTKTSKATVFASVVGIIGTICMTGSIFAATGDVPQMALCLLLAVPGIIGWVIPYFLYLAIVRKQTEKMNPIIEAKYDEIYEICKKGNNLLH